MPRRCSARLARPCAAGGTKQNSGIVAAEELVRQDRMHDRFALTLMEIAMPTPTSIASEPPSEQCLCAGRQRIQRCMRASIAHAVQRFQQAPCAIAHRRRQRHRAMGSRRRRGLARYMRVVRRSFCSCWCRSFRSVGHRSVRRATAGCRSAVVRIPDACLADARIVDTRTVDARVVDRRAVRAHGAPIPWTISTSH